MQPKLYIYTRVSSTPQTEKFSLIAQSNEGIKKANELNLEYEIWEEAGRSASKESFDNRPVISKLVEMIELGQIKYLFVTELDRLSRAEITQFALKKILADNQVTLYTTSRTYNFNDAEDDFFGSLLNLLARHENKLKSKRSIRGKIESVARGRHHGGMTAFGYTTDKNKLLVIDVNEAKIYKMIVNWSLDGIGVHNIAKKLNEMGIKPKLASFVKKELTKKHGVTKEVIKIPKSEMIWRGSSVLKILKNPLYKGERKFIGKTVAAPAIISSDLWKKIQLNLKANNTGSIRNMHVNKFLLHGLCICNRCNNSIWAKEQKSCFKKKDGTKSYYEPLHYYYCSSKQIHSIKNCSLRSINQKLFEDLVWKNVTDILTNSKMVSGKLKNILNEKTKDTNKIKSQIKKLTSHLKKLDDEKNRILTIFSKGIISEEDVINQNQRIENERREVEIKVSELNNEVLVFSQSKENNNLAKAFSQKVKEIKNTTDFEFKKKFLRTFVKYIYVDYIEEVKQHVIEITLKYPLFFDKEDSKTILENGMDVDDLINFDEPDLVYTVDTPLLLHHPKEGYFSR